MKQKLKVGQTCLFDQLNKSKLRDYDIKIVKILEINKSIFGKRTYVCANIEDLSLKIYCSDSCLIPYDTNEEFNIIIRTDESIPVITDADIKAITTIFNKLDDTDKASVVKLLSKLEIYNNIHNDNENRFKVL